MAFVGIGLARLLDSNNALEHVLGGNGGRGDDEAKLASAIGELLHQENRLAASSLASMSMASVSMPGSCSRPEMNVGNHVPTPHQIGRAISK